jgi:glycosyltransferase involved in cell wall biosynthesis
LRGLDILCVHPHYDLYGSDRCFIESVASLRAAFPDARIRVLLPKPCRLSILIKPFADEVSVAPLWVVRKRYLRRLLTRDLFSLPQALARAYACFRASDLVYINTITAIDYMVVASLFRRKTILHVHEAPAGVVGWALGMLVRAIRIPTIFNSKATCESFSLPATVPSYVLYNGIKGPETIELSSYDGERPLRVLMLGRLSRGKGQDVLIEACARLPRSLLDRLDIRIVGSSFDAHVKLEEDLRQRAKRLPRPDVIRFEPFVADTRAVFEWCDLAVIPSRVPEGFGRVAVEAMSFGRPAIVAAHGGLKEIVIDGVNGWHFAPNDADALARQLKRAINSPESIRGFGRAGRARYQSLFSAALVDEQFRWIVHERARTVEKAA